MERNNLLFGCCFGREFCRFLKVLCVHSGKKIYSFYFFIQFIYFLPNEEQEKMREKQHKQKKLQKQKFLLSAHIANISESYK